MSALLRLARDTEGCKALTDAGTEEKLVLALQAKAPHARRSVLRLLVKLAARRQSRWVLLHVPGGVQLLAALARDSDAAVRQVAAELLERIGSDQM